MAKIDYEYEITEEQIRAYLRIPEIDRLRWLEELRIFTSLVRQAPTSQTELDLYPSPPMNPGGDG